MHKLKISTQSLEGGMALSRFLERRLFLEGQGAHGTSDDAFATGLTDRAVPEKGYPRFRASTDNVHGMLDFFAGMNADLAQYALVGVIIENRI